MREAFAHDAVVLLESNTDLRAPGAAITVALCDHWDHQPPCPLAPHHTHAEKRAGAVHLRILFATAPEREALVRQHIDRALRAGQVAGPDGVRSRWQLRASQGSAVGPDEADHAQRLRHHGLV